MKKFITAISMFLCLSVHSQDLVAAGTAGLTYETFRAPTGASPSISPLTYPTVLSTGISTTINYPTGSFGSNLLGSGRIDNVIVHWFGYMNIPTAGSYTFGGNSDDGLLIKINNTTVLNGWFDSGGAFKQGTAIDLPAGVVPVEVWYYENGGGQMVNFQYLNGTTWSIVPSTMLATDSTYWTPTGPTVTGGTITQLNASSNQVITSGGTSTAGPTSDQQTIISTWQNSIGTSNLIMIEQVYGSNNNVTFTQDGNKNTIDFTLNGNGNLISGTQTGSNYLKEEVPGWGNNITTIQTNTVGTNFTETKIQGNGNTVNHTQTGNGNKILFSVIQGDVNTLNTTQSGDGAHFLETKLTGNFNNVKVDQFGSTANKANIDVTNAGGPASVDLQQTGGKNFTIIQSCVNPAGCTTVVRQ